MFAPRSPWLWPRLSCLMARSAGPAFATTATIRSPSSSPALNVTVNRSVHSADAQRQDEQVFAATALAADIPSRPTNGTGVVMLNMGGPSRVSEVGPFLQRLFSDGEIIQLGRLQSTLGPFLAKRRTPRIARQYEQIGGSPIRRWTEQQGRALCDILDRESPATAPHRPYAMFRYADPLTEDVLRSMQSDGVTRAVAFSQYPQFSCTTTGSSLNHLWRELARLGALDRFQWSIIDRWPTHPQFIAAVAERVQQGLQKMPADRRDRAVIVFSAHSLPMRIVNRGDPYSAEVAATVHAVMEHLRSQPHCLPNSHMLAWQSQVGFLPWLGPQTGEALEGLARQGHREVLLVPIAFTSDHIETLYELDIEYAHVAQKAGIKHFVRSESLNASDRTVRALADIMREHLESGAVCSPQYPLNCAGCSNPICRSIVNPIRPYSALRDRPA